MVTLEIPAPLRIDHDHVLTLSRLRLTLLVAVVRRVCTRHRFARVETAIALRHHYLVDSVELDLVLLVECVEVQPDLAILR